MLADASSPFQAIPDTLHSPLPGGVNTLVRFLFQVPQWIQIGGAILGVVVGIGLAVWLWRQRMPIWTWLRTRSAFVLTLMVAGVAVLAVAGAAFGFASWHYMQHDNGFCIGCHVMGPAFQRFTSSEHSQLECHDCHQQPITASMRQLYLWVLERPEEIGEHAPVADAVCARCHIQEDPDSTWQRISVTAGHRLHLESDSSALEGAQCVTCHGVEVHRFVPPDETCGQSGCHAPESTQIRLGAMAQQTMLHCVVCHEFTAVIGERAPQQTVATGLVPGSEQCLGCHAMAQVMADFEVAADPHEGDCGMCHNPHTQETPAGAVTTCGNAGCHAQVDTLTPFHRGIHAETLANCVSCHAAHTWTVNGSDCRACHRVIR